MKNRTARIITVSVAAVLALCTAVVSTFSASPKITAVYSGDTGLSSGSSASSQDSGIASQSSMTMNLSSDSGSTVITAEDYEKYGGKPETFEFEEKGYKNKYEQILAEDGFIYGIDYDWFPTNTVGSYHIGNNQILGVNTVFNEYSVEMDIYNMAAMGYNALNVWLMTSGQGLLFDDEGTVTGIDPTFLQNMEKILILCRKYDIACVPSILPHGYADNYGNGNGTETPKEIWDKYFRFYYEDEARQAFIDNAVTPLCELFANYQDVIPICNLIIENASSVVSDEELGIYFGSAKASTWEQFKDTINALHYAVKEQMPNMMTSTENMGDSLFAFLSNETEVDLIGQNRYNGDGTAKDPVVEYITRPTYIGEFNGGESGFDQYSQEYWGKIKANFYPSARDLGYIGAFYFCYDAGGSPFKLMDGISSEYDTFRSYAMTLSYQIDEMIKEHKGDTTKLYTPALLYNKGSSDVYWFPGKGVSVFKVERYDNVSNSWKTVASDLSIDDIALDSGLCKWTDTGVGAGMSYCYRVTSYDDEGNSAVSKPNNTAEFYVAEELLLNGGFEDGESLPTTAQETGWYGVGFGNVSDTDAYNGSYSLMGDKENGIGSGTWGGTFQKVKVKPNTTYKLTYKYKAYTGKTFVQVWDKASNSSIAGAASWMSGSYTEGADEPEWKDTTIIFTTGDYDTIEIAVKYNNSEDGKFYFDDFSLKENR